MWSLGGPGAADDQTVQACAAAAWTQGSVTVVVPANAVTGPLKLIASTGLFDDTTPATRGPAVGNLRSPGEQRQVFAMCNHRGPSGILDYG